MMRENAGKKGRLKIVVSLDGGVFRLRTLRLQDGKTQRFPPCQL